MGKNVGYPTPKQEYKVLVRCATYNHSNYIEDALNGFAIQQTNFSFVCMVMDDASTDGEQEVIKQWMERECDMARAETIVIPTSVVIIVPHRINTSCTFAFYLLNQNLYGTGDKKMNHVYPWREKCEYEAICEGDDYWTDPLKLQKQVEFMEHHPDYTMCCTDAVISAGHNELDWKRYYKNCQIPTKDIIMGGGLFIQTARKGCPAAEYGCRMPCRAESAGSWRPVPCSSDRSSANRPPGALCHKHRIYRSPPRSPAA